MSRPVLPRWSHLNLRSLGQPPVLLLGTIVLLGVLTPWSLLLSIPVIVAAVRGLRRWDGLAVGAALLGAGEVLSLPVSIDLHASLTALAGLAGAIAVAILLTVWWRSGRTLEAGLVAYAALAAVVVLVGTVQVDIQFAKVNAWSAAVYGVMTRWPHLNAVGFGQNGIGAFIVTVFPFTVALARRASRAVVRVGAALVSLWLIFALLLTLSRGAYLGLALGLGAMIWLAGGRTRWLAPLPTLITVGLLLRGITGYEFTLSTTPTGWSSVDRLYIWHAALRMLADFPLTGPGVGTFPVRMPSYTWPMEGRDIPHAHNFLLQTYLDGGLLGLVGLLTLLAAGTFGLQRVIRAALSPLDRAVLGAAAAAAVAIMAHGTVDAYFWGDARTFYLVAVPFAVLLSLAHRHGVSLSFPEHPPLLPSWETVRAQTFDRRRFAPVIALGLCAVLLGRPVVVLAGANTGNVLREHAELLPPGSLRQAIAYAAADAGLQVATHLENQYGAAWQDLAEVSLDRGNTAEASHYLQVAGTHGQHDALVVRDGSRLSELVLAQAAPGPHLLH